MKNVFLFALLLTALILSAGSEHAFAQKKRSATKQPPSKKITIVDHPKQHAPTDTVGVVNGTVITFADFNSIMNGYLRAFVKRSGDNLVTDSLYSVIVDSAWDKAIEDILVEQTIQKEHLSLSDSEAVEMIVANPPEFLANQVRDAHGTLHTAALRQALTDPRNDSVTQVIVQGERLRLENEKFLAWLSPKAQSGTTRDAAYAAWLRKAKAKAVIMDKRLAFGFY
jgi:hypothetical protein